MSLHVPMYSPCRHTPIPVGSSPPAPTYNGGHVLLTWLGVAVTQVYGECDHLKLHDVVEVLGIMAVVPELAALHYQQQQQQQGEDAAMDDADEFWQERVAALPPTSQVMRLHAVAIKKVPANPLAPKPSPAAAAAGAPAAVPAAAAAAAAWSSAAPELRQQVLSLLSGPLAGDELAAEYLLLTCLSSVRNGGVVFGVWHFGSR